MMMAMHSRGCDDGLLFRNFSKKRETGSKLLQRGQVTVE
jgi:hypothetical protein